jgi:hypothetical protein
VGTPAVVQEVQIDARTLTPSGRPLFGWIAVGLCGALGMVITGSRVGSVPGQGQWWFTIPHGGAPFISLAFYVSTAVFIVAWLGLGRVALAGGLSVKWAWVVLVAWGLPFLVGPPLFSRDLYSYVAQGVIAHHGLNPYKVGPDVLGPGQLLSSVASVWRHTTSPYGPLFVALSKLVAAAAGRSLVVQVIAFRILELIGVGLVMVSLPRLARHLGTDPGVALWLGALSPLALFSFVSSGHNDALMAGLLVAGVTLALEGRLLWGLALCALAATVKLPAAAAVIFLLVNYVVGTDIAKRWRVAAEGVAISLLVFVGVTLASGYGWTWLGPTALKIPTELRVLATPSVSLGVFVFHVLHPLGLPIGRSATVTVVQTICEVAAVSAIVWLLFTIRRHEVVRSLGIALILIVVGSPTLWPWYLMWGLVLLAATTAQRSRALAVVAALAMLVVGPSGSPRLLGSMYIVMTVAVVAVTVWLVRAGRWRSVVGEYVS